jgi:hypothetical protein
MPRTPVQIVGRPGPIMWLSKMTAPIAGPGSPAKYSIAEVPPLSSSPSTTNAASTGSSPAAASRCTAARSMNRLPLSSLAPRAYRLPSRTVGSKAGDVHRAGSPGGWTS